MKIKILAAFIVALLGVGIAAAVAATTGTVSVCSTAHTVAVDGVNVKTIAAQCVTKTYTVPTQTVTQTVTVGSTTSATTTTAPPTFPTPTSVGVPAGTTLTPLSSASLPAGATNNGGELDVTGNNLTLSGLHVTNGAHINGQNDTIKNSRIDGETLVYNGDNNTTFDHDELTAHDSTDGAINSASGHLLTVTSSYLHDNCTGVLGERLDIENDYIITDASDCKAIGAHSEDVYVAPGTTSTESVLIQHNTLLNPLDETAAVFLDNHAFGGCGNANVTINDNLLAGGDYPTYGDKSGDCSKNIVVTNNRFSRKYFPNGGVYGPDGENVAVTTWTNNVWDDTGLPVPENGG